MPYKPNPSPDRSEKRYEEFNEKCIALLGLDASVLLEIARVALADAETFDMVAERMDISDETLREYLNDIQAVTDGILVWEPEDFLSVDEINVNKFKT